MKKKYDALVLIGRFQPLHNAHLRIIEQAQLLADKVIVIVGSANQPRTHKNPFTFEERKNLIISSTRKLVYVEPNVDTIYDDEAWVLRVQNIVSKYCDADENIGLIGYSKDDSTSRYLKMFPQWKYHEVEHQEVLDATQIRDLYFSDNFNPGFLEGVVPSTTRIFLAMFWGSDQYNDILAEKKFIDKYIEAKKVYPYPIIAVTVDSVVVQSGHILLIKRRSIPGKGLWALPGGYFDAVKDRTPLDGILRELEEETKIDVPDKVLRGSLKEIRPFGAPGRSLLGRSITFAGHFRLNDGEWKLPKVRGEDDAEKAKWVPLSEVKRERLFDDHYDIIQSFLPSINAI